MTLVILGTQDKTFERLLKAVEKQIKLGNLKGDVIVQAGSTKYESKCMKIFDYISMEKFDEYIKEADLVIAHGGVGTILSSVRKNKKVIAVPRLSKYKEHENDHQLEIVSEFTKRGYIIPCYDLKKLDESIKKAKEFEPKKYRSNNRKMLNIIENYIDNL